MPPPIISPYKKWFSVKRIVQTFLGGPKLVSSLPIILLQTIIYIIPVVIICDVNTIADYNIAWEWKALLTGLGILLSDVTLTFLIWILKQRKDINITPQQNGDGVDTTRAPLPSESFHTQSSTLFGEEETVPSDGILRSSTWKFIAPNVNMTMCHFFAVVASAVSVLLCEAVLIDKSVHAVLKGFVIFTVCNARYSSVISAAPEVATFDPVHRRHVFYRPFYVAICALVNFGCMILKKTSTETNYPVNPDVLTTTEINLENKEEIESIIPVTIAFILAFLPLIWLSGILPPLDAFFPWLFETILCGLGAKSVGYTYFGTTVSLGLAIVGPLATFILSQEPKVTLLLECLCGYLISCDTGSMPKLKASLCEDVPVKYFLQQLIKPSVTILCSISSVFLVVTIITSQASGESGTTEVVANREIFHPILASISIFLLLTTKMVQAFDVVHYHYGKWASSRLFLGIFSIWHGLLTIILHVWLSLELMTEHFGTTSSKSLETVVVHSLNELLPCILTIRIFALSVTEPRDSTINIFATYLYQTFLETPSLQGVNFVKNLFIISIIHAVGKRFLRNCRMIAIFIFATFKSTLLPTKYTIGATILTVPLTIISLIVSSIIRGMNIIPMFTLPIFIVGFPRPLSFWKGIWFLRGCSRNETQKILPASSNVDWTIYADVAPFLVHAFAKHCEENKIALVPGSCFLARYDDRLVFIRVVSSGWKFCYLQVKGLEIQEQTSCHYQEAAWVDEIFGKYLTSKKISQVQILCSSPKWMVNSLEPRFCLTVPSYSESKSQIPNFLSRKGKLIFRDMFFRAFSYLWIKGNPAFQGESYRRPTIASGVPLGQSYITKLQKSKLERSQFNLRNKNSRHDGFSGNNIPPLVSPDMNGNRAAAIGMTGQNPHDSNLLLSNNLMSNESIRWSSAPMRHHPHLKDVSARNWQGSMSYPLIPGLPNSAVDEEDPPELLDGMPSEDEDNNAGSPSTSGNHPTKSIEIRNEKVSPLSVQNTGIHRNGWDGLPQFWMKQCVGDAIPHNAVKARVEKMCWKAWEIAFGTFDDLFEVDMARFYRREFANTMKAVIIQEKTDFEHIVVRAFRYATKLTLDEIYSTTDIDTNDALTMPMLNHSENFQEANPMQPRSEEDEKSIFLQLCNFEKTFRFCSYDEVPYWINDKAKHIVSIAADGDKNVLRIFNYESGGIQFAIGELSQYSVEGIWANLNIELLYLTSDDDERYSIQNNKYLLRNLSAQCAQTLGYPVYEATFRVNLFEFSVEQLSS